MVCKDVGLNIVATKMELQPSCMECKFHFTKDNEPYLDIVIKTFERDHYTDWEGVLHMVGVICGLIWTVVAFIRNHLYYRTNWGHLSGIIWGIGAFMVMETSKSLFATLITFAVVAHFTLNANIYQPPNTSKN